MKENSEYIKELEEKVRLLEETNSELEAQVQKYKNLLIAKNITIDEESKEYKFVQDENFSFNEFAHLMKDQPELIKMTMISQLWDGYGANSESRTKFLDKTFQTMIKYMLPDDIKIIFMIVKNIHLDNKEMIQKIAKATKYKKITLIENGKLNEIELALTKMNDPLSFIENSESGIEEFEAGYNECKEIIESMIFIKKKLSAFLVKIHELYETSVFKHSMVTLRDGAGIWPLFRQSKYLTLKNLYGIEYEHDDEF